MLHVVSVGIDTYRDERIRKLSFAGNDAREFAKLFADGIASEERQVRSFVDAEATREALMTAIGVELAETVERDDVAILYFACHGSPESVALEHVGCYLIPYDTNYDRIFATGIDLGRDVVEWIGRLRCKLTLVILDTCFSGAALGRTFCGPNLARGRDREEKLRGALSIKDLDLGRGQVVLAACGDVETAIENPARGHGIFTYHLLDVLSNGQKRTLGLAGLYEDLVERVRLDSNGRQTPTLKGDIKAAKLPVPGRP